MVEGTIFLDEDDNVLDVSQFEQTDGPGKYLHRCIQAALWPRALLRPWQRQFSIILDE